MLVCLAHAGIQGRCREGGASITLQILEVTVCESANSTAAEAYERTSGPHVIKKEEKPVFIVT